MTPRNAAQNQALRDATRKRILEAALRLFSREGYASTTIRAIAQEAGIAQGLLYSHFKGKKELLKALFRHSMDEVRETFAAVAGALIGRFAPAAPAATRSAARGKKGSLRARNRP